MGYVDRQHKLSGETVSFLADDGFPLSGELFPGTGDGPLVLISAATAAPARFYRAFAKACIEAGSKAALIYDYRDVATSKRPSDWRARINYKDHALLDFPAATAFLDTVAPGHPMVGAGQSLGGFALGLSGVHERFDRYLLVSVISGYLGYIGGLGLRAKMLGIGMPIALMTRRLPRWAFGEPMASSTYIDWARWCLDPDFLFGDPNLPEKSRFTEVDLPLRAIHASDDPWATPKSVDDILSRFENAPMERHIVQQETAAGALGHLGFFNARYRDTLWHEQVDWRAANG